MNEKFFVLGNQSTPLIPLAILFVVAVTLVYFGVRKNNQAKKMSEIPCFDFVADEKSALAACPAHVGEEVIVGGLAYGPEDVSPWSGRAGLLFDAEHRYTRLVRGSDGKREQRRERQHLGTQVKNFAVVNESGSEGIHVDTSTDLSVMLFPSTKVPMTRSLMEQVLDGSFTLSIGGGDMNQMGFGSENYIEETIVAAKDRVWVSGTLQKKEGRNNDFVLTGKSVVVSGGGQQKIVAEKKKVARILFALASAVALIMVVVAVLPST